MVLVPDLRPTLITAPGFQPYCAGGLKTVLNSSIDSMGSIVPASPPAITAFMMLWAIQGSFASTPLTKYMLSWGRLPFAALVHPALPTYFVTPGRRLSR